MIDLTNEEINGLNKKYLEILEHLPHDKNQFLYIVDTGIKYLNEKHNKINVNKKAGTILLLRNGSTIMI